MSGAGDPVDALGEMAGQAAFLLSHAERALRADADNDIDVALTLGLPAEGRDEWLHELQLAVFLLLRLIDRGEELAGLRPAAMRVQALLVERGVPLNPEVD